MPANKEDAVPYAGNGSGGTAEARKHPGRCGPVLGRREPESLPEHRLAPSRLQPALTALRQERVVLVHARP